MGLRRHSSGAFALETLQNTPIVIPPLRSGFPVYLPAGPYNGVIPASPNPPSSVWLPILVFRRRSWESKSDVQVADWMKQKGSGKLQWKNQRHGFRHELIQTLTDNDDLSWREAQKIVDAIFDSIKERLRNNETVSVAGFGTWTLFKPASHRSWKFGQVVKLKTRPVFHEEQGVLRGPFTFKWKPHPAWKSTRDRTPDRRSNKYKEEVARREQERHYRLLVLYMEVIGRFFTKHGWRVRPAVFWNIRWNTYWFKNEEAKHRPNEKSLRPIEEAEQIIAETAVKIPRLNDNVEIDYVEWYARWTVQLDVDRKIWKEAEERISAAQRGLIYFK